MGEEDYKMSFWKFSSQYIFVVKNILARDWLIASPVWSNGDIDKMRRRIWGMKWLLMRRIGASLKFEHFCDEWMTTTLWFWLVWRLLRILCNFRAANFPSFEGEKLDGSASNSVNGSFFGHSICFLRFASKVNCASKSSAADGSGERRFEGIILLLMLFLLIVCKKYWMFRIKSLNKKFWSYFVFHYHIVNAVWVSIEMVKEVPKCYIRRHLIVPWRGRCQSLVGTRSVSIEHAFWNFYRTFYLARHYSTLKF